MATQTQLLGRISETLRTLVPEAKTILFGSRARGDARADSDYDLLILLPDNYQGHAFVKRKLEISGILYDLSLNLGVEISPLILVRNVFYSRKTPFTINVLNEGIEL